MLQGRRSFRSWLLLFCIVANSCNAATAQKKHPKDQKAPEEPFNITIIHNDEEQSMYSAGPSSSPAVTTESTARRAAAGSMRQEKDIISSRNHRGIGSPTRGLKSHRMKDQSLAQQVEYMATNSNQQNSFENLLKLEDERQKNSTTTHSSKDPPTSPFFLGVLGSSVLLAITSFILDPSSAHSLWKTVWTKKLSAALAVAWLPFVWGHPAKLALVDLFILIQLVRQPAVLPFIKYQVLPVIGKTLETMIVTELWTRTWKWFFAHWDQLRQSIVSQMKNHPREGENDTIPIWKMGYLEWPTETLGEPPALLVEVHRVLVGGIRRGLKSAFKKSVQETIMSSLSVWRTALEEQIIVA